MSGIRVITVQIETTSGDDDYDLIGALDALAESMPDGVEFMITAGSGSTDDIYHHISAGFDPDWDYKL